MTGVQTCALPISLYIGADNGNVATSSNLLFGVDGTERARIDSSGNLGLGVTPSASWQSIRRVLQVGGSGAFWASSSGAGTAFLSNNTYFDGTSFRYLNTSGASYLAQQTDGSFTFNSAPSGTAGNAISFTQAMTLDASGTLLAGLTSSTGTSPMRMQVKGGAGGANPLAGYSIISGNDEDRKSTRLNSSHRL